MRVIAQFAQRAVHLGQNPAGALQEYRAHFRGHCAPPKAVKQLVAKLALKFYNLLAERWLAYVVALGCTRKAARFGHGHKVAELV
jgi:hypothetical protein